MEVWLTDPNQLLTSWDIQVRAHWEGPTPKLCVYTTIGVSSRIVLFFPKKVMELIQINTKNTSESKFTATKPNFKSCLELAHRWNTKHPVAFHIVWVNMFVRQIKPPVYEGNRLIFVVWNLKWLQETCRERELRICKSRPQIYERLKAMMWTEFDIMQCDASHHRGVLIFVGPALKAIVPKAVALRRAFLRTSCTWTRRSKREMSKHNKRWNFTDLFPSGTPWTFAANVWFTFLMHLFAGCPKFPQGSSWKLACCDVWAWWNFLGMFLHVTLRRQQNIQFPGELQTVSGHRFSRRSPLNFLVKLMLSKLVFLLWRGNDFDPTLSEAEKNQDLGFQPYQGTHVQVDFLFWWISWDVEGDHQKKLEQFSMGPKDGQEVVHAEHRRQGQPQKITIVLPLSFPTFAVVAQTSPEGCPCRRSPSSRPIRGRWWGGVDSCYYG